MLSEETLERLSERLANRIEELNTYFIRKIGNQIYDIGTIMPSQLRELFQSVKYGNDIDEIMSKIADVTDKNVEDIYKIFEEVAKKSQEYAKQFYEYKKVKFIPYDKNISLQNHVKAIAKATVNEYMNISKTMAFMTHDDNGQKVFTELSKIYQKITDRAIINVSQGRESFETVMKETMKDLSTNGIRIVNYASGYHRRADSSVRMNLQDGLNRLNRELQEEFGKEFDADGIEVTHHKNSAPDHIDTIDGKQFSKNGKITIDGITYDDFNEINSSLKRHVGELNCQHKTFSIILGVSKPLYSKEEIEADKKANEQGFEFEGKHYTNYEGTQLQRQIETKIRKLKDRQIGAKSIKDMETVYDYQEKIGQLTKKYKDLSDASNLPTRIERLRVDDYRSVNKKILKSSNDEFMVTKNFKIGKSNDLLKSIKISEIPNNYGNEIINIINNSNNEYTYALNKYQDKVRIKSYAHDKTARYNLLTKDIKFNAEKDKKKGYQTFFHEYSHMIDHKLGNPSQTIEFNDMIYNDFKNFKSVMKKKYNINDKEFYKRMAIKMNKDIQYNSLSDIIGGITENKCLGKAKHKIEYWKIEGKLGREFYAHLGSAMARNSELELYNFKAIFPNCYKYFLNSIINGGK